MIEIVVPQVGEASTEVTLLQWLKREGEQVRKGDALFEIDTDKAVVEVEAFADGTLLQVLVPDGSAVMPLQVVGLLSPADATTQDLAAGSDADDAPPPARAVPTARAVPGRDDARPLSAALTEAEGAGLAGQVAAQDVSQVGPEGQSRAGAPAISPGRGRVRASPKARRLAAELGVDLPGLAGSGVDGLISAKDVQAAAEKIGVPPQRSPDGVQPLSKLRRAIATRMQASKQTVPHFYLMADVDMTEVQRLRARTREESGWTRAPSLTDVVVRACALSLASMPAVNLVYTDEGLAPRTTVDIGIAVGVEGGLLVSVLPKADRLDLRGTSERVQGLIERARQGRLREADLSGKSMVVSNLGMHGVDAFVAIIDMPDPMILAVGRVAERIVPRDGKPAVRRMCTLTLSIDHRVLDGVQGSQFLMLVKKHLENACELLE